MATAHHQDKHRNSPRTRPTKRRAKNDFGGVMERATESMPRSRQLFSRFIHLDVVYSTSELIATIFARPNAILFGSIVSFVVTLAAYLFAKNFGYNLSGFETIGAFMVGWLLGTLFDIFSMLVKKK